MSEYAKTLEGAAASMRRIADATHASGQAYRSMRFARYTPLDFLAEIFGELRGGIDRLLSRRITR